MQQYRCKLPSQPWLDDMPWQDLRPGREFAESLDYQFRTMPDDCSVPGCEAVEEEDSGLCAYHLNMERGYSYDWPDFHDEPHFQRELY